MMNGQVDIKLEPKVDHDINFRFEYFSHKFLGGLLGVLLGNIFPLFE